MWGIGVKGGRGTAAFGMAFVCVCVCVCGRAGGGIVRT